MLFLFFELVYRLGGWGTHLQNPGFVTVRMSLHVINYMILRPYKYNSL